MATNKKYMTQITDANGATYPIADNFLYNMLRIEPSDGALQHLQLGVAQAGSGSSSKPNGAIAIQMYTNDDTIKSTVTGAHGVAIGYGNTAGEQAFAEGSQTQATGSGSHSEGAGCIAKGDSSHAEGNLSKANGNAAHAEGYNTTASGYTSHTEGKETNANNTAAHAEGQYTIAEGIGSHAEGQYTRSVKDFSHAEGSGPTAFGKRSHAEGGSTILMKSELSTLSAITEAWNTTDESKYFSCAYGENAHVEGNNGFGVGGSSHVEGTKCYAYGGSSHAEGSSTKAMGAYAHSEGSGTIAGDTAAHAEGSSTRAYGLYSHTEGRQTTAFNYGSHAEGQSVYLCPADQTTINTFNKFAPIWDEKKFTVALGHGSHAEGKNTVAFSDRSHAEGEETIAQGYGSHAQNYGTRARGKYSTAMGVGTDARAYASVAIGVYNNRPSSTEDSTEATDSDLKTKYDKQRSAFIIGNGDSTTARSNAFRVRFDGEVYAAKTYHSSGADYAEYFEWADFNPNKEDRVGRFVTIANNNQIALANTGDEILGVISGHAAILGDAYEDNWTGMYDRDIYGRLQYEKVEVEEEVEDEEGNITIEKHIENRIKLNPNYDPTQTYIPRSERPEWAPVGLMGKLVLIDDGSCIPGGKCSCGINGIATNAETGYHVLKRLDDSHIQILLK